MHLARGVTGLVSNPGISTISFGSTIAADRNRINFSGAAHFANDHEPAVRRPIIDRNLTGEINQWFLGTGAQIRGVHAPSAAPALLKRQALFVR